MKTFLSVRHVAGRGWYATLRDENNDILISATLQYVLTAARERNYELVVAEGK